VQVYDKLHVTIYEIRNASSTSYFTTRTTQFNSLKLKEEAAAAARKTQIEQ
jgi:hypothetical protein